MSGLTKHPDLVFDNHTTLQMLYDFAEEAWGPPDVKTEQMMKWQHRLVLYQFDGQVAAYAITQEGKDLMDALQVSIRLNNSMIDDDPDRCPF